MTTVIFNDGAETGIRQERAGIASTEEIVTVVVDGVEVAERMAAAGHARVHAVLDRRRRNIRDAWRDDALIRQFFGGRPTIAQIKSVRRRLDRAHRRLDDRELKIRLFPQDRAPTSTTMGQNLGGPFSPLRFKIFSRWFRQGRERRAAILVHELMHDWFTDATLRVAGERVTVRGVDLARRLADERPARARTNPENYEQFCLAVFLGTTNLPELEVFRDAEVPIRAGGPPRRTTPTPKRADAPPRRTPSPPRRSVPPPARATPVPPRAGPPADQDDGIRPRLTRPEA